MPQFDFSTYAGQIFWFTVCFLLLYFFMAIVILPRIRDIMAERKTVINDDVAAMNSFNESADENRSKADAAMNEANAKYKAALDEAAKTAALKREKSLEEFKENAENLIKKSQAEIAKMVESSKSRSEKVIEQVATLTQNKIFN